MYNFLDNYFGIVKIILKKEKGCIFIKNNLVRVLMR